jgi:hypothetical protein
VAFGDGLEMNFERNAKEMGPRGRKGGQCIFPLSKFGSRKEHLVLEQEKWQQEGCLRVCEIE